MGVIITKAACFVAIIFLGYVLRRVGYFKESDFGVLSKIVLRITLPASVIYSFSGKTIEPSLILLGVYGLILGIIYMGIGYLLNFRGTKEDRAFSILNIAGFNIGNFTMPFAQGFLGPSGVIATSLFDTGNAFICLGMAYSVAAMVQKGERFSLLKIIKELLKSIPFDTYIVMATLTMLKIRLPGPIVEFSGVVGNANAFLAMLMVGVGFHLSGDVSQYKSIVKILGVRYSIAIVISLVSFFLLPVNLETRQALAIAAFSPIASAAPAYTNELGGDTGMSSAINSLSIVIGVVCIVAVALMVL